MKEKYILPIMIISGIVVVMLFLAGLHYMDYKRTARENEVRSHLVLVSPYTRIDKLYEDNGIGYGWYSWYISVFDTNTGNSEQAWFNYNPDTKQFGDLPDFVRLN